jgi:hypothetical protein
MKHHYKIYSLILLLALSVSACGAQPVPTINAADVQHTAEAAAFTMVAQTMAAIPTATPLPPTEIPTQTPLPTDTPVALPTLDITLTPAPVGDAPAGGATVDPCSNRVLSGPQGRETIIRIVNTTKQAIRVSMYLNETAGQGACGWRSFDLAKNNDIVFTDLVQGCYNIYAWTVDSTNAFRSSGGGCINNPDKWTFEVSATMIKNTSP